MAALRLSLSRTALLLLLGCPLLASCDRPPSAAQPLHPGDVRTFVTPAVAGQLTPEGRFPLVGPAPERYPQISPEKAAEIAVAWVRTFGSFFRPYYERDYGARIEFDELEVVSPVWYAAAVYEAVPEDASPAYRNAFGPHYLLYLGRQGVPVLGVSVAAFAGSSIGADGVLTHPPHSGNEVIAYGVAPGRGFSYPVSPEQAARVAATASGARVAAPPELINPHRDYHPYHARWKITLERPVEVRRRSGRGALVTPELYVGPRGELLVPAGAQEDAAGDLPLESGGSFTLRRRSGRPVVFEQVAFDR